MEPRKSILIGTLVAAVSLFCVATFVHILQRNTPIAMQTSGFPTIGKASAPVEVVLIEDFQCKNCREFSKKILPDLQKQYVKEGKVRFTLVPVAFLAGSQMLANALLEVQSQNPSQFFPYLKDLLIHDGEIKMEDLMRLAKRLRGINLEKLQTCIEKRCHSATLQKNLTWAQGVMGSQFRTPALYINGSIGSTYSFGAIKYQIDQNFGKK